MSLSECERFTADMRANPALGAEAEKAWADKSHDNPLAGVVALAVSKGYSVTLEEAQEHVKSRATATGQVLSDADLDGVAAAGERPPGHKFPGGFDHVPL
jgi:hypothetical protein